MSVPEAFPLLNTAAGGFHSDIGNRATRLRRKSSGLGQQSRAGQIKAFTRTDRGSIASSGSPTTKSSSNHARHTSEQKNITRSSKGRSVLSLCKSFAITRTWSFPLLLLLAFLSLYCTNPTESTIVRHFIFLSYRISPEVVSNASAPVQYGKGLWDIAFVSFYTVVLTFTREFVMQELLHPLARRCGIRSRGKQLRFIEQTYTAVYFTFLSTAGIFVMRRTPVWYFNTRGMYEAYPHKTHEAVFKFYYLFQAAYWAQQAIVLLLGMEKPRKDFKMLVGHHIVALALIALSYRFHFTYMGIVVYLTHDMSDLFLAISKTVHYLDSCLVGPSFGICIAVWIYLRHYLNLRLILSLFTEFKTVGPYELNWETQRYKCLLSNVIALGLLAALQTLNLIWLFFLLRSAYRFVVHRIAKDDRSEDDEGEELEEIEFKMEINVRE